MATNISSLNNKKKTFVCESNSLSDVQYLNLRLNQNGGLSSKLNFKEHNVTSRNSKNDINHTVSKKYGTWNKNIQPSHQKSFDHTGINEQYKEETSNKFKNSSSTNSSTLSLHIAAYENSIDFEWIPDNQLRDHKYKKNKRKRFGKKSKPKEVPFEIPRQQENQNTEPEVMQFKASQRILNPNDPNEKNKENLNEYTDEKMLNLVFNGTHMDNLNILPLPDQIKVPQKKGTHVFCYSTVVDDSDMKNVHKDDQWPWMAKSRTKNFVIKNVNGKVEATENRNSSVVTHGQCYYVTHGKYTGKNVRVHKKEIKLSPPVNNKLMECSPSKTPIIGLETFFNPMSSPVSSIFSKKQLSDKDINNFRVNIEKSEEKLKKEIDKKEEAMQKSNEYYYKWYKLSQRFDEMNEKKDEQQKKFKEEISTLKIKLEETKDESFKLEEKAKIEKRDFNGLIKELENQVAALKDSQQEQQKPPTEVFEIKIKGKYIPKAKLTMSKLTHLGLAVNSVGPAMGYVAEMFGKTLNAIPSSRTVAKTPFLTSYFIREQIRRAVASARYRGITTTSCTDETKKNGFVYQNYRWISLDEENKAIAYCLGTIPVIDKSSEIAISTMKNLLESLNTDDGIDYWETFVMGLGNRMSDEAATEKLLTKRVEAMRRAIIGGQEQYDHLTEEQKDDLAKLRTFFCQLHVLQNLTPVVTNILLEDEKERRENPSLQQPFVIMLLKLLSKHLGNRAASKYTSNMPWKDYCERNNIPFGQIPDFVGNRFNIVFAIAACVFFLREEIIKFIETINTDLRQTPVLQWLKDPIVMSHLHLLAAFNLWITAPLLRLTEHSTSITSLSAHAESLIEYLKGVKENPTTFFTGHAPFEDYDEAQENTKRSLAHIEFLDRATLSHPDILENVVEELAEATIDYFSKKYVDFLPGGKHHLTSADVRTVPRHNKGCEHDFGILTWDYRHAPNKRSAVRSIRIQETVNKTYEWFDKLSQEEKEKLLNEALVNAPILEKDAEDQQQAYEDARWNRLLEKQRENEITDAIKARKQAEANNAVQKYGGCWVTVEQMNAFMEQEQRVSEKRKAVEAQLKYHKLSPSTEKGDLKLCVLSMLNEQRKRVPKQLDVLCRNLQALIIKKSVNEEEEIENDDY
uniref:Uncharacterized protein n=1 Tax=Panagrolaimus sp. ES5 TaxID=591445 RepID=A0AC34GYE7_9BILA